MLFSLYLSHSCLKLCFECGSEVQADLDVANTLVVVYRRLAEVQRHGLSHTCSMSMLDHSR